MPQPATRELGKRFAALIRKGGHQLGTCAKLGIPHRTHKYWLAKAVDEEQDPGLFAYQQEIWIALDESRIKDLAKIEKDVLACGDGKTITLWNMRKLRHEALYRAFYAEDSPARMHVELSGPEGGAIPLTSVTRADAIAALRLEMLRNPELRAELALPAGGSDDE